MRFRLRVTTVLALVLLGLLLTGAAAHAQSPFTQGARPAQQEIYRGPVPQFVRDWSRSLQQSIATLSQGVVEGRWASAAPAFLLAVAFGVVHIIGPGHGKVFAISYFAGRDAKMRDGLVYSVIVNAVDSMAALALVIVGYVVLRAVLPAFRVQGPRLLELVSYGLIVVFGTVHLISHLRPHAHGRTTEREHGETQSIGTERPPWLLAVSVGLVPCPVSTILLVYGVANGVLPFMIGMVVGVSIGGFFAMSLLSLAVIYGRAGVIARLKASAARRISAILEFAASGSIIIIGLVLFLVRL